jgi:predicted ATPase/DNA-binding winged helix-turn-helix (wHTH) protein
MSPTPQWIFEPFRLDTANACLWRGDQMLALRPKVLAVLTYLVAHAGQLVTKEALLEAAWPETAVSDAVLKECIGQLRKVLGETASAPRFIATMHRRGYRFIAPVTVAELSPPVPVESAPSPLPAPRVVSPRQHAGLLVERETALRQLHMWFAKALQGRRQVVFITGEPGIGKTTVVEAFTAEVTASAQARVVWGQCVDQYGAGEAYLPVLEALGRLCRGPDGDQVVSVLRQQAPTWLVQMPWLLSSADRETLQYELHGATRERMLREFAEALATLTAEVPLVLVLEDLHWSDHATLDLLAVLARRREPARFLLLGTYRPVEVIVRDHALRTVVQDLQLRGYCAEIPLEPLSEGAVAAYLTARFPGLPLAEALIQRLYQRTDGNPLFLVSVIEHLINQGVLVQRREAWEFHGQVTGVEVDMPESVRQMIAQQFDRLTSADQQVLEAGSVVGAEFAAAAVAAGLEREIVETEAYCEALGRQGHMLQPVGVVEWPDGTVTTRYAFRHALYQEVAYQRLGVMHRVHLHRRIGTRLEAAYGEQASELATELAEHFVRGRDQGRAVRYLQRAAATALFRHAYREAIDCLSRALTLLETLPDTLERGQQELALLVTLGPALIVTKGYAAADVERVYSRAYQLCQRLGDTPQLFSVLVGLRRCYQVRASYQTAHDLGDQLLAMAQHQREPAWLLEAHFGLGIVSYYLGDFLASREHCAQGIRLSTTQCDRSHAVAFGQDPGVACHAYAALGLWALGYPEQALSRSQQGLTLARELAHPFSVAFALLHEAVLRAHRQEVSAMREVTAEALTLAQELGFAFWVAWGTFLQGWVTAVQGEITSGILQMRQGVDAARATSAGVGLTGFLTLLAEAYGEAGQPEAGLNVLAEASTIANHQGERYYAAEIHRLTGVLLLAHTSDAPAAETAFQHALDLARNQHAKALELRATISLSRLWQQQGKGAAARRLLAEVYSWFTEGLDTTDLREAATLLEELA